jgi:hypothetical protein
MREAISVAGGLVTGFMAVFVSTLLLLMGDIAGAGMALIASALAFGLVAISSAISGKR